MSPPQKKQKNCIFRQSAVFSHKTLVYDTVCNLKRQRIILFDDHVSQHRNDNCRYTYFYINSNIIEVNSPPSDETRL